MKVSHEIQRPALTDYTLVCFQLLLFIAFPMRLIDYRFQFGDWLDLPAWLLLGSGVAVTILALLRLNFNLSIFPTPPTKSELIQTGIYKYIRHPIYSGILLIALGWSLMYQSLYQLAITILLALLFWVKSTYEEQRLQARFPEYAEYKNRTGMFLP
jgi:protein-S-isoprenylcysteine O-methyltransferase Ste14